MQGQVSRLPEQELVMGAMASTRSAYGGYLDPYHLEEATRLALNTNLFPLELGIAQIRKGGSGAKFNHSPAEL